MGQGVGHASCYLHEYDESNVRSEQENGNRSEKENNGGICMIIKRPLQEGLSRDIVRDP